MFLKNGVLCKKNGCTIYVNENIPLTPDRFDKLKNRIYHMTNYDNDYLIIEVDMNRKGLNFLQFVKGTEIGEESLFYVEVRLTIDDASLKHGKYEKEDWQMFGKRMKRKELISLIEQIFINKIMPDFSDWRDITANVFKEKILSGYDEFAKKISNEYFAGELGENGAFLFYEAQKELKNDKNSSYDEDRFADRYDRFRKYEKIRELYDQMKYSPWLQKRMGDIEFYGYIDKPDYKKAFRYYSIAAKRGNIHAKFMIGQMYKDGLFVCKDIKKYEKITFSLYDLVVNKIDKTLLPKIENIALELSYIEESKGNNDVALWYAEEVKKSRVDLFKFSILPERSDYLIAKQILKLKNENPDDIDLYDLSAFLDTPRKLIIVIDFTVYTVNAFYEDEKVIVEFDGKYFKDGLDFLRNAKIYGKRLYTFCEEAQCIEVE